MPFFNLTRLGVQDPIKSSLKESDTSRNEIKPHQQDQEEQLKTENKGQSSSSKNLAREAKPIKSISEAQGSYVKYTERLTKHQRTENGIVYQFFFSTFVHLVVSHTCSNIFPLFL